MDYYLGVDIGTTSAKAVAFSLAGEVINSCSCAYTILHPKPNQSEQDPGEILKAVVQSCNQVVSSATGGTLLFIAFSAAMHSIMAIDKEGEPVTNCIIWADSRASAIADALIKSGQAASFYQATGVPVHAMSPFCKLLWLKENEPGIFANAYKFIGIKEYVCHKLCGEYLVDTSVASSTGLLNIYSLEWDHDILDFVGISHAALSQLVTPKHKAFYNKANIPDTPLHIPDATMLIIGASDGALANLGAGAVNTDTMAVTIGTSGAARVVTDHPETDSRMRTFCYHLQDNRYIIGGAGNNGAIVLEWLKDKVLESADGFAAFFDEAEKVAPGSDNLLFIPHILGERAPLWNSNARGLFFGLDISHTRSHLIRSSMEGVIYGIYGIAVVLLEGRAIREIHVTGGFAQSSLWLQILADVCNIKVLVSGAVEASALGAVMVGLEATGREPFPAKKMLFSFEPDLSRHHIYMKGFRKFERVYELLKNEWVE